MRKSLERKAEKYKLALNGYGVIIDQEHGRFYRLAVAPDGWCRVCQNDFIVAANTVVGPATHCWDYMSPKEAIDQFNRIKRLPGMIWRKDDRVLWMKEVI